MWRKKPNIYIPIKGKGTLRRDVSTPLFHTPQNSSRCVCVYVCRCIQLCFCVSARCCSCFLCPCVTYNCVTYLLAYNVCMCVFACPNVAICVLCVLFVGRCACFSDTYCVILYLCICACQGCRGIRDSGFRRFFYSVFGLDSFSRHDTQNMVFKQIKTFFHKLKTPIKRGERGAKKFIMEKTKKINSWYCIVFLWSHI